MQTLKNLRAEKGLSLDDLAARSGLSKSALWQLERGKNGPTLTTLEKLAKGLGCEITDLLPGGEHVDALGGRSLSWRSRRGEWPRRRRLASCRSWGS